MRPGFYVEELLARRADVVGCDAQLTEEFSAAGSVMKRLIEPTPEPEMERSHPRTFEKLSREPGFIIFRLRKSREDITLSRATRIP